MKKFLKVTAIILGCVIVVLGGIALYINFSGIPKYDPGHVQLKVELTPARVANGKKIVSMLCANCHMNPETNVLTGKRMEDAPAAFGEIHSRNITQHPERGIAKWTDGELMYFLRTGVKRDGQYAPPYMVKLPLMSDEDLFSVIAFLHSDDPWVQPKDVASIESKPSLLVKVLSRVAWKPLPYPEKPIVAPPVSDKIQYGRYIATAKVGCFSCHSKDFKTMNELVPEKSEGFFGGGNQMLDLSGKKIYTRNITPDQETGIGKWSEAEFIRAVRHSFRPDNSPLRYPMVPFIELSDEEVSAVYAYLRTVPPLKHQNIQSEAYTLGGDVTQGQKIYYKYSCYSCHGEAGVGVCDLTHAHMKYHETDSLIAWIRDPQKITPGSKMPTWNGVIAEHEYVPLVEYVRLLGERARTAKPTAMK